MSNFCFQSAASDEYRLTQFNSTIQAWGEFIKGYMWDAYACMTFRKPVTKRHAFREAASLFRFCGKALQTKVAYIAVPEWRPSGCGMPPSPLHLHAVAAGPPQHSRELRKVMRQMWSPIGNIDVRSYDPAQAGAFYLAKTAAYTDFDPLLGNLDLMSYNGPRDLHAAMFESEYAPEQAKRAITCQTLTIRRQS